MSNNIQIELERILVSIEKIELFTQGKRMLELYIHDEQLQSAIGLQIIIIGECTRTITKLNSNIQLNYSREIIGLRNRIAHAYDSVDHIAIWNIVINHLPKLKQETETLLKQQSTNT